MIYYLSIVSRDDIEINVVVVVVIVVLVVVDVGFNNRSMFSHLTHPDTTVTLCFSKNIKTIITFKCSS
jgi:hypothetical protein